VTIPLPGKVTIIVNMTNNIVQNNANFFIYILRKRLQPH